MQFNFEPFGGGSYTFPSRVALCIGYAFNLVKVSRGASNMARVFQQQKRKLTEQCFGWAKTVGGIRQVMVRGLERADQVFVLTMDAYNLTRMRALGQVRLQKQSRD